MAEKKNFGFKYLLICSFTTILLIPFSFSLAQSPYSLDGGREVAVFGGGVALGVIDLKLIGGKVPVNDETLPNLSGNDVNWFDRGATYNLSETSADLSNVLLATAIASPLFLFGSSAVRNNAGTYSTMYLQNILSVYSISHLPKALVKRYRPYVYNEEVPNEEKQSLDATHSFLSAHTAVGFASAVFLSVTFDNYNPNSNLSPYIWTSSLLLATSIGYLRYAAGQHFPTDIIAGAVLGSVIGYLIPLIHESNKENLELVAPAGNPNNNLVSFNIKF